MKTNIELPTSIVGKKIDVSKLVKLIAILIVSIAIIISIYALEINKMSAIYYALTICGYTGIITTIILLFRVKSPIYLLTNSKLKCKTIEFSTSNYDKIQSNIENGTISKLNNSLDYGNGMIVEIIYSEDYKFAAYQYFKYVPHYYEPDSEVHYIAKNNLLRFFE